MSTKSFRTAWSKTWPKEWSKPWSNSRPSASAAPAPLFFALREVSARGKCSDLLTPPPQRHVDGVSNSTPKNKTQFEPHNEAVRGRRRTWGNREEEEGGKR